MITMYSINSDKIQKYKEKNYHIDDFNNALKKSKNLISLSLEESAALLYFSKNNEECKKILIRSAKEVTDKIFGEKITIFIPLYISNFCRNRCSYCVSRADNIEQKRIRLTKDQFLTEVNKLASRGFTGLEIVSSADPKILGSDYARIVELSKNAGMRAVMSNIELTHEDDYRQLHNAGLNVYMLFQETYHPITYQNYHPVSTHKGDMSNRLRAQDKAAKAGISHLGLGVLFGLYNWEYEVLSLLDHACYLKETYGVTLSFSVPRVQKSPLAPKSCNLEHMVTDDEIELIVALLRLSFPSSGIGISTRETREMRNRLLSIAGTSTSGESSTSVGGHAQCYGDQGQFPVHFIPLEDVIEDILSIGKIPNFCTACSQSGIFGGDFERFARSGELRQICQVNSILSFAEYIHNYAKEKNRLWNSLRAYISSLSLSHEMNRDIQIELQNIKEGKKNSYYDPIKEIIR